jgi:hypothetical protein
MCLDCGFYKGRQVIDLAAKKQARVARINAKKEMIASQFGETTTTPTTTEAAK